MRTVLILNPVAGQSPMADPQTQEGPVSNKEEILAGLRTYGIEPEVWYTTPEDPGKGLARKAADEHYDLVIAAGGDGTIHAVASGLIKRESTLGIIPMGTMNNLAHSLGIPLPVEAACAIIGQGETRALDVGQINEQTFIEVAGVGFEASLFPAAEDIKKSGLIPTVRGVMQGLYKLLTFRPTKLKISFDEKNIRSYDAIQVTICNAPYYGDHFQLAPNILMDDGVLDVFIYRYFSKLEYIKHAISISQGRRVFQPKISRRRVQSLHIASSEPLDIHADGLPHGQTPANVTVASGALRVLVPTTNSPGLKDETPIDSKEAILQVDGSKR
ncbi:MAG: diacylglycerol/lipid kinase family protein [Ktedonobacteraceae bacterium]